MDDQYGAGEVGSFVEKRRFFIASRVNLRTTHVPLRISGVVEFPIGHRRNGDAGFERMVLLAHGVKRLVAAVRPTDNRHAACINILTSTDIVRRRNQVLRLFLTQRHIGLVAPCASTTVASAAINNQHRVPLLYQRILKTLAPAIEHSLALRTAVVHDD